MPRARNIKPGFFVNDALGSIEPLARILFIGLWCHADREGRIQYRPKKFKVEILPYDTCDVENLIQQLLQGEFIHLYEIDGVEYLQIIKFSKHQNPHVHEAQSIIPPPTDIDAAELFSGINGGKHPKVEDTGDVIERIPMIGGEEFQVRKSFVDELSRLYVGVDVATTLKEIRGWCLGNPTKLKTPRGIKRFITSWMQREQNHA